MTALPHRKTVTTPTLAGRLTRLFAVGASALLLAWLGEVAMVLYTCVTCGTVAAAPSSFLLMFIVGGSTCGSAMIVGAAQSVWKLLDLATNLLRRAQLGAISGTQTTVVIPNQIR